MGKGMKMQKIQEERDKIKLKIEENEKIIKELEQKRDEALLKIAALDDGKLNWNTIGISCAGHFVT